MARHPFGKDRAATDYTVAHENAKVVMSTFNLEDKFEQLRKPVKTSLEAWIDTLDSDDRAAVERARKDPQITNADFGRVIATAGISRGKDTVSVWRNG